MYFVRGVREVEKLAHILVLSVVSLNVGVERDHGFWTTTSMRLQTSLWSLISSPHISCASSSVVRLFGFSRTL
eukprot:3160502-Amphidinium_carterae.1